MQFEPNDLATLQSILAELKADSGTVHAIGADGALHLRAAIGIPEPVLAIVKVVPVGPVAGSVFEATTRSPRCILMIP